ncbi:centrosomal protein of 63 kDa isoform X3 [Grammomys surdaster]|nr:centrosomal protein of 63 kDa isoform X3 [Grammomys surdaster]XP_028612447.1 centrosomal protein of 63 kDa isoform X3 [Grammomys surdaster]XP_028612448.1 centrosomal protein of 63 kDa isoform X3 [Grammomys surdaster]XP_028612449.1 centrosomal protein of 63 kDa isoform X3 [Grammomys surdaster]
MEALLEGIQNRGHSGGFLTSCEAELQELMKQIDIMVAHKKSEWEGQTHALETCLDIRDRELKALRSQLNMKHKEVGILHQQIEEHEKTKQEMAMEYKEELVKLQEELSRLKRSYEKLQKRQLREFRGNTKSLQEDRSEIERLTGKIEEFRQKSLDWEKQRLIYQQQVSSLEAQRKALAEQSEIIQAQLANRKQKLESVELSSQSEIQHLSSKLERAKDTICANELEIERLNIRVNDLMGTNMTILQEHRQKEERLRESEKLLEALQEEQKELKASLQSQESIILEAKMQKEKLQMKLKAVDTQHSVERPLEDSQMERKYNSTGQGALDNVLSQLDFSHSSEELLQAEVTRLEGSLESVSTTCKQLSQELMEKYEELKRMEGHNNEYRTEIKKLKEQILHADQTYSSALEGMKMEISQLTRELHQRDITIASAKCSSSDMEKQLKAEMQKAEEKAVEHKEILSQLESLKLENRRLSETVMKLELGLHEAKEISLADLQENYIEALNKLVSENQQLQKDLMSTKSQLEHATHVCKKKDDRIFNPAHSRAAEFKNAELKPTHGQHRHDGIKTEQYKTGHHSPRGQMLDSIDPVARGPSTLSSHISPDSSTVSLPSNFLFQTHSLPSMLDINDVNFSDSLSDCMNDQEEFVSSSSLPVSPLGSIATRFLEEEELRSHHILERLDAHIEELKRESEKTVRQFTALV